MLVQVERRHIEAGTRANVTRCPIALALSEATGIPWFITIGKQQQASTGDWCVTPSARCANASIILPESCALFMRAYESGNGAQPFEFEFDWDGKHETGSI